ncbi:hypothetical protein ACFQY7_50540 [Actinomadura luteofluorescens]|uniref:Uncharacterized protein n=1 Tax=Actinomadura luteofluorescens TaxID=46163 RepID=A0A7Y9EFR1_9ACTN|nr:hypothetical protein [Actinomadura luteofluorescens]NYD46565.1 hypothetical protein [Actinomadura luteofluorescens]
MADTNKAAVEAAAEADAQHGKLQAAAAEYVRNPTPENEAAALQAARESAPAQTAANLANAEACGDSEAYES